MQESTPARAEGFELIHGVVWVFVTLDHHIAHDAIAVAESANDFHRSSLPGRQQRLARARVVLGPGPIINQSLHGEDIRPSI